MSTKNLPILRVKRPSGQDVPDALHVRVRKRQRVALVEKLNCLSLVTEGYQGIGQGHVTNGVSEHPNVGNIRKEESTYVVFRRVEGGGWQGNESLKNVNEHDGKIVDVDSRHLKRSLNQLNGETETARSSKKAAVEVDNDNDFVMFAPTEKHEWQKESIASNSKTKTFEQDAETMTKALCTEEKGQGVAYMDAESIEELQELLNAAIVDDSSDDERKCMDEDSDFDARTVDYPTTPEESEDSGSDEDEDDDNYDDHERYEDYNDDYDDYTDNHYTDDDHSW